MKNPEIGKVCAICQPYFLPWLGYFEMIDRVDEFIVLDDVQYSKGDWVNRNRILSLVPGKQWQWLTVPVYRKGLEQKIKEIEINYSRDWSRKVVETIRYVYKDTPYFNHYFAMLTEVLNQRPKYLLTFVVSMLQSLLAVLKIETAITLSSSYDAPGRKEEKLIKLCQLAGAKVYLANNGSKPYIQASLFQDEKIGFLFQDYQHPGYQSVLSEQVTHMSVIDLMFNYGEESRDVILQGRDPRDAPLFTQRSCGV